MKQFHMLVNAIEKLKQSNDMIDGDWELEKDTTQDHLG